jgi:hypothetical protein
LPARRVARFYHKQDVGDIISDFWVAFGEELHPTMQVQKSGIDESWVGVAQFFDELTLLVAPDAG